MHVAIPTTRPTVETGEKVSIEATLRPFLSVLTLAAGLASTPCGRGRPEVTPLRGSSRGRVRAEYCGEGEYIRPSH